MFLDKHILSIFEAGFIKNLSIFEPQIEKHYAYKKTCIYKQEGCKINFITQRGSLNIFQSKRGGFKTKRGMVGWVLNFPLPHPLVINERYLIEFNILGVSMADRESFFSNILVVVGDNDQ